jgi:hypothetical protein
MMAMKVRVASQTMPVTVKTSSYVTTPAIRASAAPPHADQPIPNPFGCQMTKTKVEIKIAEASITDSNENSPKSLVRYAHDSEHIQKRNDFK